MYCPPLQGDNGTFLLSLEGTDAAAFSVSPERAAGSASVQVVVRNSNMVDYEEKEMMEVQVQCHDAPGSRGRGQQAPILLHVPLSSGCGH